MRSTARKKAFPLSRRLETCLSGALAVLILCVFPLIVILLHIFRGIRSSAVIELSPGDRGELGVGPLFGAHSRPNNPWAVRRTAHRAAGCGGHVNPAAAIGLLLRVRYALRDTNGSVADSTRGRDAVTLRLGSGQGGPIESALVGMCAGEATEVAIPGGQRAVVALERVGGRYAEMVNKAELEDILARDIVAVPALRWKSCEIACKTRGMQCEPVGFVIVNDCGRLRQAFPCKVCEVAAVGSAGKDMPCYVAPHAPRSFPRGYCLVSPVVSSSTCSARHQHTRRLCPCVGKAGGNRN